MHAHQPEKFPEPWLFDNDALLAELDRVRALVLAIPLHNDTFGPTNTAADALWELRDRLRFLIGLQAERQRAWAKEHTPKEPKKKAVRKVASISRASNRSRFPAPAATPVFLPPGREAVRTDCKKRFLLA